MVKWIQEKPEVITYLRSQYSDKALPDWVSRLEGNVNYRELLRSKGGTVPAVSDGDHGDEDDSQEEEDIAEGILPAQASTIVANDNKLQTPMDTYGQLQTPTNSNLRNPSTEAMAKEPQTPTESKLRTPMEVKVKVVPKRELPPLYYRAVLQGGAPPRRCAASYL
jgi:arsenate reductase-like glutaredoxin family protein